MDNVQKRNTFINVPSSQTFRSYIKGGVLRGIMCIETSLPTGLKSVQKLHST
jgi:hypothetical protein